MRELEPVLSEIVTLADGEQVILRPVRADDKELLRRGFERLSDVSRYHRFFAGKGALLDSELRYLTELDGETHLALVAVRALDPFDGLGVARAIRLRDDPATFEAALTVVDAHQRRGIGALLLERLSAAAAARGARVLRFCVLPSNDAMRALMSKAQRPLQLSRDHDILVYDARIDPSGLRPRRASRDADFPA